MSLYCMKFISYHLIHDLAALLSKNTTINAESLTTSRILSLGVSFNLVKWHIL